MNTQIVNETMENKMENIINNLLELKKFKTYFDKELRELDICYELRYCGMFLKLSIETKETIKKIYSDIDDISEYLFDNTDNIEEGKYLKYMVANYSMNKEIAIIDDIAKDDIEKRQMYDTTNVKFNKLHNLIAIVKEDVPIMTLEYFYEEYVKFLSYLPIEFNYNDGQRIVEELDDEIPYSVIPNNNE